MIHTYSMVHAVAGTPEAARGQAGSRVITGGAARGLLGVFIPIAIEIEIGIGIGIETLPIIAGESLILSNLVPPLPPKKLVDLELPMAQRHVVSIPIAISIAISMEPTGHQATSLDLKHRSELRGARFEEDKTDPQLLRDKPKTGVRWV
jgi:hypothetical protein